MKITRLSNEIMPGDTSVDSFPWLCLLHSVIWNTSQLQNGSKEVPSSLHYSIILDLTGIIEGFTNQLLDAILDSRTSFSFTAEELEELEDSDFWKDEENDIKGEDGDFNLRL